MRRFLPYALGVTAIWLVSSMERPPIPEPLIFWNSDKLMHACAYAVLAWLAWLGVKKRDAAWLMAAGYGIVDELHQSFVAGRSSSVGDVAADFVGAGLGAVLAVAVASRR